MTRPDGSVRKERRYRFTAYLKDGGIYHKVDCATYSDFNKALASDERQALGEYIKGKLERQGLLKRGEPVTSETLELYGRDCITLTKLSDASYILEF